MHCLTVTVMSSVAYCPRLLRQSNLVLSVLGGSRVPRISRDPPFISLSDTVPHTVRRIPWTSRDPPLVSPQTQAPTLSGGSLGHPGILPWCPLRHRPPPCLEDPLDIPGSSLGVPTDIGPHDVLRIPGTSRDPPFISPETETPWCPEDP